MARSKSSVLAFSAVLTFISISLPSRSISQCPTSYNNFAKRW